VTLGPALERGDAKDDAVSAEGGEVNCVVIVLRRHVVAVLPPNNRLRERSRGMVYLRCLSDGGEIERYNASLDDHLARGGW
jgi:hypothetical protein